MSEDNKRKKLESELVSTIKREQRRNYIILYSVTFLILIVLILISVVNGFFTSEEFIVNILHNIIGILPPLLIFDFFNEKLSRDASAMEMSNKITETLMSNPETLDLFTEEQRKRFLQSTIESVVRDADVTEMITNNLENYLMTDIQYKIRTEFIYNFELYQDLPAVYDVLKDKSQYFYIQEKLHYKVKYLSKNGKGMNSNEVKIGFLFGNMNLDNVLRDRKDDSAFDNCIFRESLSITAEDIEYFFRLQKENPEEMVNQFKALFKLDLQIDGFKGLIKSVEANTVGILVKLHSDFDVNLMEHTVRIIFHMPMRWGSVLEVAIVDPTKAPKISLSYPEDVMDVDMYSFLSKGEESALEVAHEHQNGVYDIVLNTEWMYPISGMVFTVEKK